MGSLCPWSDPQNSLKNHAKNELFSGLSQPSRRGTASLPTLQLRARDRHHVSYFFRLRLVPMVWASQAAPTSRRLTRPVRPCLTATTTIRGTGRIETALFPASFVRRDAIGEVVRLAMRRVKRQDDGAGRLPPGFGWAGAGVANGREPSPVPRKSGSAFRTEERLRTLFAARDRAPRFALRRQDRAGVNRRAGLYLFLSVISIRRKVGSLFGRGVSHPFAGLLNVHVGIGDEPLRTGWIRRFEALE